MILDVKRNNTWSRIAVYTNSDQIGGALYTNYTTNANTPADLRYHGADGISVKLPQSGGSFHFWTNGRMRVAHGAQEIVTRLEARLILDNASGGDDRASAKLLVNSAGDVYRSAQASWAGIDVNNTDTAIGRFKYATNEWQSYSSHTLSTQTEINDYLAFLKAQGLD